MAAKFRTLRHPLLYVGAFLFVVLFRYFGDPLMRSIGRTFDDPATRLVVVLPAFLILLGAMFGLMRIGGPEDRRDTVDFKLSGPAGPEPEHGTSKPRTSELRNPGTPEPPHSAV